MENRVEKRIAHYLDLMFGGNDTYSPGTTLNVSPHGMRIQAENQIVPLYHEIRIMMSIGGNVIGMRGVVCWNSEIFDRKPVADKNIGIFIADPRPEYVEYVSCLA